MMHTLWLSLFVAIGLYGVSSYIRPTEGERRNPQTLVAGILSLVYAALHLHATFALVFAPLPHAAVLFRATRWIVGGMFLSALATLVYRQSAGTTLIISAVLFAGLPLAMLPLHWVAPKASFHRILTSPALYAGEAFPVGLAIPALVLLPQKRGRSDAGEASAERTSGEGTEV